MAVGDTNLFFNRDTKVYAVEYTSTNTANVWQLPVLNGYSFSQSTNASQVTLNEMASVTGNSRRGQMSFNDSLAPAEWSFDLYARPTTASSVVRAPEEVLWHALLAETVMFPAAGLAAGLPITSATIAVTGGTADNIMTATFTTPAGAGGTYFTVGDKVTLSGLSAATGTTGASGTFTVTGATNSTVSVSIPSTVSGIVTPTAAKAVSATFATTATALDFFPTSSNKTKLGTFDLYFVLGASKSTAAADTYLAGATGEQTTIYKIANCCVNEATVNFEIDGITTISFSGMGTVISEQPSWTFTGTATNPDQSVATTHTLIQNGVTSTTNMIRNRLTALGIVGTNPGINGGAAKTYGITLTGGSITISNNMSFLTPESIGVVNTPLGHVAGTRSISGSFTCYADEATNGSIDLYQDLLTATNLITNKHQLQFFIGGRASSGTSPASPGIMFDLGQCHLEVPSVNIDDVIGFEVNFTALPTTISGTDELTKIRYVS